MKRNKMTFSLFKEQCEEIFSAFSEHSTMHDLRVWEKLPYDNFRRRKCWYCVVRLNEECQMMITYDPYDEDKRPYVCWYDYQVGTLTYSHWAFETLDEAMVFCCKEPHQNYRSYGRGKYILYRDAKFMDGTKGWQCICNLSLLAAVDYIQKYKDDMPSGLWELRSTNRYRTPDQGEMEYRFYFRTEHTYDFPFTWSAEWEFPYYLYEP